MIDSFRVLLAHVDRAGPVIHSPGGSDRDTQVVFRLREWVAGRSTADELSPSSSLSVRHHPADLGGKESIWE